MFLHGDAFAVMFNSALRVISQVPRGEPKPSRSSLKPNLQRTTRCRLSGLTEAVWVAMAFARCPIKTLYVGVVQHFGRYIYHAFISLRDAAVLIS